MGDRLQVRDDVGGKQHDLFLRVSFQNVAEVDPLLGVQPGGRLVQDQKVRFVEQGLGDAQPAAHSAGKGPELFAAGFLQADRAQQFLHPRFGPGAGHPFQHGHIQQKVPGGVPGITGKLLWQIAQPVPVGRPQGVDGDSIQAHPAGRGPQDPADHPQQGGFPRPVGTQQAVNAGLQNRGDPGHRRGSPEILAQVFKQQFHRWLPPFVFGAERPVP